MTFANGASIDTMVFLLHASIEVFDDRDMPAPLEKIITRGGNNCGKPMFFVAKANDDLYIIIRGATEPSDFMIVLDLNQEKFLDGEVHAGVLRASRWIIEQSRELIESCKGKIYVSGHSLGGACAGMVSAILRLEENKENVYGFTAASFPVFSPNIKAKTESFITSVVYNNDVVPKLTRSNISTIVMMMQMMMPQQEGANPIAMVSGMIQQMLEGLLRARGIEDPAIYNALREKCPVIVQTLMGSLQGAQVADFTLPGVVYQVRLTPEGPQLIPFQEGPAMLNPMLVMAGVADHDKVALKNSLHTIAHPPPPPTQTPTGNPTVTDDLD